MTHYSLQMNYIHLIYLIMLYRILWQMIYPIVFQIHTFHISGH